MTEQLGWIPVKALARQLMLFESEVAGLVKDVPGRDTKRHFNKTVRTPQFAPKILKRSAKVADRMMAHLAAAGRSEEHTSELQSLMRNSYAVFFLKKKQKKN